MLGMCVYATPSQCRMPATVLGFLDYSSSAATWVSLRSTTRAGFAKRTVLSRGGLWVTASGYWQKQKAKKKQPKKKTKLNELFAVKLPAVKLWVGWPTATFPGWFFQLVAPIWKSAEWRRRRGGVVGGKRASCDAAGNSNWDSERRRRSTRAVFRHGVAILFFWLV